MKLPQEFHCHPVKGAVREALRQQSERIIPPLPSHLMHLINYPWFVYVSKADPNLWGYTPNLAYLGQDRQVRKSPGKILRELTKLSDHEIRDLVTQIQIWTARRFPKYELLWATTEDDVEEVYTNLAPMDMVNAMGDEISESEPLNDVCATDSSVPSCMGGSKYEFNGDFHPARIYGSSPDGSIAVAYLEDHQGILARVVCSMKAKTYVRVYERKNSGGGKHLEAQLQALGFTPSTYLVGTVRLVWYATREIHMPYLDLDTTFHADMGGETVALGRHLEGTSTGTRGTVSIELGEQCECCGSYVDEDDLHYVEYHNTSVCSSCLSEEYTYAYTGRWQEYVPNEYVTQCRDTDEYYTDRGIDWHGLVWDSNEDLRHPDYVTYVDSLDRYEDNDEVFMDYVGDHRAYSEVTPDWWVVDGRVSEEDPQLSLDEEDTNRPIQIGTIIYSLFWTRKQSLWLETLRKHLENLEVSREDAERLSLYLVRKFMASQSMIRQSNGGKHYPDVEFWERKALQYGVSFNKWDKPVIYNQYNLAFTE